MLLATCWLESLPRTSFTRLHKSATPSLDRDMISVISVDVVPTNILLIHLQSNSLYLDGEICLYRLWCVCVFVLSFLINGKPKWKRYNEAIFKMGGVEVESRPWLDTKFLLQVKKYMYFITTQSSNIAYLLCLDFKHLIKKSNYSNRRNAQVCCFLSQKKVKRSCLLLYKAKTKNFRW